MSLPVSIHNGTKLPMPKPGMVIGARTFRNVVRALNGLLNAKIKMVEGQNAKVVISEASTVYEIPTSAGGSGSGTAAVTRMRVKGIYGDYLQCRTWDGTTEGGSDINVAKSPTIRHSVTSENVEGTTLTYTYASRSNNDDGQRSVNSGAQIEIVQPIFHINARSDGYSEIFAAELADGVQIDLGDTITTWIDLNVDGRKWNQVS